MPDELPLPTAAALRRALRRVRDGVALDAMEASVLLAARGEQLEALLKAARRTLAQRAAAGANATSSGGTPRASSIARRLAERATGRSRACNLRPVDVVVPIKPLHAAKTRLRGAVGNGDAETHSALALALAHDTIAAVRAARMVRRLLVVSTDPVLAADLAAVAVEVVPDPGGGLNAAVGHGAALLRARDAAAPVGALQADLPALRPEELDAAVVAAGRSPRAFCADAGGTGTTLLLAAAGVDLAPRFGAASATAHRASGARPLTGSWPGLRHDVDTPADLCAAAELGLGAHTRAVLSPTWSGHDHPGRS